MSIEKSEQMSLDKKLDNLSAKLDECLDKLQDVEARIRAAEATAPRGCSCMPFMRPTMWTTYESEASSRLRR
jgi:hypothetical protein